MTYYHWLGQEADAADAEQQMYELLLREVLAVDLTDPQNDE